MQLIKGRKYERFKGNVQIPFSDKVMVATYLGEATDGMLFFDIGCPHGHHLADPTLHYKEVVEITSKMMDDSLKHIVPPFVTGEPLKIPEIFCILGVTCSGKTTYIDRMLADYQSLPDPIRPVIVRIGQFLRDCLGAEYFTKTAQPGCPQETDSWVKSNMTSAFDIARFNRLPVILDGFPRSVAQLEWLMYSSTVGKYNEHVTLICLVNEEQVILDRLEKRTSKNVDKFDRVLALQRLEKDAGMLADIQIAAGKMTKYPVTVKVVEF